MRIFCFYLFLTLKTPSNMLSKYDLILNRQKRWKEKTKEKDKNEEKEE